MGAIKERIIEISEDLKGLGLFKQLDQQLGKLEANLEQVREKNFTHLIARCEDELTGYKLALNILVDALLLEREDLGLK